MTFKRKLAILKYTMLRGYAWCQMPTLAIIGAGVMKPYLPNISIFFLAIITICIFLTVGLIDKHFGIMSEESNYATETNPLLMKGLFPTKPPAP